MSAESVFVVLFSITTTVALVARRVRVPYTVALVVAGIALGATHALAMPHLTKELLFAIFLPGLLFEAAFHLEFEQFRRNQIAILSLAVPGVVVAMALTGALLAPLVTVLKLADGFGFRHALVFAALIAATDPIAVVALFKSLAVPTRLSVLVEGESLLNDGTAVVFFSMVTALLAADKVSAVWVALDFVRVVGFGALIGAAVGAALAAVSPRTNDPLIEIMLTTLAAYGSFVVGERLHFSGVIATVVAGMVVGNRARARRGSMGTDTLVAVESFWAYMAFALNSAVFLLLGFAVNLKALVTSWKPILVAYVVVMVARAVIVLLVTGGLARSAEKLSWRWSAVITWGGLRGALSMVLVLALPEEFPFREFMITMTFGVVLISLLLQGLTMGPLLRWLGLASDGSRTLTSVP